MTSKIDQIIKLLKEIEAESYKQGRADGIDALAKAAQAQSGMVKISTNKASNGVANAYHHGSHPMKGKLKSGTATHKLFEYVRENSGLSAPAIVQHVASRNPAMKEKTLRNTLDSLRARGFVENENGKWRAL